MLDELVELSNAYEEMVRIRRNRGIAGKLFPRSQRPINLTVV